MARTTARGRARREQVLSVALAAFAANGFRGTSTSAIAAAAGISEAGLLHHFPTKRDLLLGVLAGNENAIRQRRRDLRQAGESFCSTVVDVARAHEADPSFVRLFIVLSTESTNPEHPAHEWFRDRYERIRQLFVDGFTADREAGEIDGALDPELLARQVIALLDGLELQFLLSQQALSISGPLERFFASLR